ncbi:hypothetical protein MGWOODY_Clf2267 [hydrothermal vent metagenome]|uniref:Uncharacterized protein n=1 Tax=hydrothermal vent metagenome TaxID=652676 RepID=A0A160VAK0_9ZZZZ
MEDGFRHLATADERHFHFLSLTGNCLTPGAIADKRRASL